MTRKEKAIELHDKGFNCAQAVACAFAEETGIPEEILFAACEGFGLGMGSNLWCGIRRSHACGIKKQLQKFRAAGK